MSKLIRIQSKKTISVTSGLQCQNVTNPDAHVPDRLRVSAEWPKLTVLIKEGVGEYPAEIAEWPTVKALVRDEILTIGAEVDAVTEEQKEKVTEFEHKESSIRATTKKKKTLEQLTEE